MGVAVGGAAVAVGAGLVGVGVAVGAAAAGEAAPVGDPAVAGEADDPAGDAAPVGDACAAWPAGLACVAGSESPQAASQRKEVAATPASSALDLMAIVPAGSAPGS